MKLEGTHQLQAPRERVYECLTDPEVLQRCIPGMRASREDWRQQLFRDYSHRRGLD